MAVNHRDAMSLDEERSTVVKVGSFGRITIPSGMRKKLGIKEAAAFKDGDLLEVQFQDLDSEESATAFLEVDTSGRVTIPEGIREYLDLEDDDLVKIHVEHADEE